MRILGWILFLINIMGLVFCIYKLQPEVHIYYLSATGILLAQTIYIAKTLMVLKKFDTIKERLEDATRRAGLHMARIISGEKSKKEK